MINVKIIKIMNNNKINSFIDWLIYIISYTIILIVVSILFESVYIDNSYFWFMDFSSFYYYLYIK